MKWFSENEQYIHAECENCERVLKIPRTRCKASAAGFIIKPAAKCTCGIISDQITGIPTKKPGREERNHRICGESNHDLDYWCRCRKCGKEFHDLDDRCRCRKCDEESHDFHWHEVRSGVHDIVSYGKCLRCGHEEVSIS